MQALVFFILATALLYYFRSKDAKSVQVAPAQKSLFLLKIPPSYASSLRRTFDRRILGRR